MRLTNKYNKYYEVILLLTGILMVSWLIWYKFIRARLPKDIPFFLSEIRFYSIVFICLTFIFLIIITLFPRKRDDNIINNIIEKTFIPLKVLDEKVKDNKSILTIINNINYKFMDTVKDHDVLIFIEILKRLLPRLMLLIIFIIDVIFINKIEIFYFFIWIGFIPLYYRYKKYQIKNSIDTILLYGGKCLDVINIRMYDIKDFEANDDDEDEDNGKDIALGKYDGKSYTLKDFGNIIKEDKAYIFYGGKYMSIREEGQVIIYRLIVNFSVDKEKKYIRENFTYEKIIDYEKKLLAYQYYSGMIAYSDDTIKKAVDKQKKEWAKKFELLLLDADKYNSIYKIYTSYEENFYIKSIKIFIYIGYLTCWSYILVVSYPNIINLAITTLCIEYINNNTMLLLLLIMLTSIIISVYNVPSQDIFFSHDVKVMIAQFLIEYIATEDFKSTLRAQQLDIYDLDYYKCLVSSYMANIERQALDTSSLQGIATKVSFIESLISNFDIYVTSYQRQNIYKK